MIRVGFLNRGSSMTHVKLPSWIGRAALKYLHPDFKTPENTEALFVNAEHLVAHVLPEALKKRNPVLNAEFFRSAKDCIRDEFDDETQAALLAGLRQIEREHFELEF